MVGYAPAVLVPAMTYGVGTTTYYNTTTAANTGSVTGGTTYKIQYWNNIGTNTSTYPINWDTGTNASTVVEMDYIQFQTFDTPYVQVARGPGYNVRVVRYDDNYGNWINAPPLKTPAQRLREILDSRMAPNVLSSCKPLGYTKDIRELRARETLQRVLGEEKFRDFVRRGSVSVRAKSGLVYQIFPGHDFTKVYDRGKMVDQLCVVLNGDFPPTDSLIMRYLMILNNEKQFRGYAVKHGVYSAPLPAEPDQRSLVEIFKEFKKVA